MKFPKLLPCRLHPKDKVMVYKTFDEDTWVAGCSHTASCPVTGVTKFHAINRWNELQKERKKNGQH